MRNTFIPPTNFDLVSEVNEMFGNPKGNPLAIDKERIKAQMKNILDEYKELQEGFDEDDTEKVRDALCDIMVFTYGAFHLMGINADVDMASVTESLESRLVKNDDDLQATLDHHAAHGVAQVYVKGDYPRLVVKSAVDQPDAPKGKFLKSASYHKPVFVGAAIFEGSSNYNHVSLFEDGEVISTHVIPAFPVDATPALQKIIDSIPAKQPWGLTQEQSIPGDMK